MRRALFALPVDPELLHELAIWWLEKVGRSATLCRALRHAYVVQDDALRVELAGLRFPNPVGLAAGFDKDGRAVRGLEALGFGFIEVGTVTWYPQPGNPRPRLFRLPADQALVNRMGFNNKGAEALAERLSALPSRSIPIGVSIGKSRRTPLDDAVEDYLRSFTRLYPLADYFAINVSSPNTQGLRALQAERPLDQLLGALRRANEELAGGAALKPVFVKVSPDLSDGELEDVVGVCQAHGAAGLIATNTTTTREGLRTKVTETGGLSGRPLRERALRMVSFIRARAPELAIIGVGGIFDGSDAFDMLRAGANLVQVYTGFVYRGPSVARSINLELLQRMAAEQVESVAQLGAGPRPPTSLRRHS